MPGTPSRAKRRVKRAEVVRDTDTEQARPDRSPRSRNAPSGDTRLTINIRDDVHAALKIRAVHERTTVGELIEAMAAEPAREAFVAVNEKLQAAYTDLRNTRAMLQAARAEVATVRKAMAELQEHYAKPWWQRFFDWLVT